MTIPIRAVALCISLVFGASTASAQDPDDLPGRLKRLEEAIRSLEQQIVILNGSMRQSRSASTADSTILEFENAGIQIRGASSAKVAIIEFSDLECPFCARYHQETFRLIDKEFVESARIRYGFRHFPIEQLHSSARQAAAAVECAGEQGKFWEYMERVFANQTALSGADLTKYARADGLQIGRFQSCVFDGKMTAKIGQDLAEAHRLGLTGTPSFFLGKIEADGSMRVSRKIIGAQKFEVFRTALESILDASETKP
jgi:protein-disulfide isomerase